MHHCVRIAMEAYHKLCHHGRSKAGASSSFTSSQTSQRSKSTVPTIYSDHRPTSPSKRQEPVPAEYGYDDGYDDDDDDDNDDDDNDDDDMGGDGGGGHRDDEEELGEVVVVEAQDSVSTYVSTAEEDRAEEEEEEEIPEEPHYEVFDRRLEYFPTDPIPSNPQTFADLFPSSRRLLIRHDDATLDGNMNLRVDTVVPHRAGYQVDVTLFHLRMYDLFSRKFSFRRYCRDSGREVCRSERKKTPGLNKRLAHSCSVALATLRPGFGGGGGANGTGSEQLKRHRHSESRPAKQDVILEVAGPNAHADDTHDRRSPECFTDTTMLEFSNYAHVEVKRRNAGISKFYEYEYWTTKYQWRKECRREGGLRNASYYLVDMYTSKTVAHLVPDILTPMEAIEEESKGGWVPPSSIWISDPAVYEKMSDVAE